MNFVAFSQPVAFSQRNAGVPRKAGQTNLQHFKSSSGENTLILMRETVLTDA